MMTLAALAVCGVACTPAGGNGENGGNTDNPGGGETTETTFTITVSNVTSNSAAVSVVPSNNNETYYFDVYEKATVAQFGSLEAFATALNSALSQQLATVGYSFADALSKGPDAYEFTKLDAGTEYYAFAYGVTGDAVLTTAVNVVTFTTEASTGDEVLSHYTYGYYENMGDKYGVGAATWYIDLYSETTWDMIVLEVQTAADATSFEGTYPFASTGAANTAIAGYMSTDYYVYGSFWGELNSNNQLTDVRFMKSGSVTIAKDGANYTITVDSTDDSGAALKVTYNSTLEEWVDEDTAATKLNVRRSNKNFKKPALKINKTIARR